MGNVVGSSLVDIVVQPVGIEELAGGAPANHRVGHGVVAGEVVGGNGDVQPLVPVAPILLGQGVGVVLGMAQDKELAAVLGLDGENTGLPGSGQKLQAPGGQDVLGVNLGVAGVRSKEIVVEAPEQWEEGLRTLCSKTPKTFWGRACFSTPWW